MTPCRTFKVRDKAAEAYAKLEQVIDELKHGNEPNWDVIVDTKTVLWELTHMLDVECADLVGYEDKAESLCEQFNKLDKSINDDIFTHWLHLTDDNK